MPLDKDNTSGILFDEETLTFFKEKTVDGKQIFEAINAEMHPSVTIAMSPNKGEEYIDLAALAERVRATEEEAYQEAISTYDKDGDGEVTLADQIKGAKTTPLKGFPTREEFKEMVEKALQKKFDMDRNDDAILSQEELKEARRDNTPLAENNPSGIFFEDGKIKILATPDEGDNRVNLSALTNRVRITTDKSYDDYVKNTDAAPLTREEFKQKVEQALQEKFGMDLNNDNELSQEERNKKPTDLQKTQNQDQNREK